MKKNLIAYSLGVNPTNFDLFKISLESLDNSNKDIFDVLIITDDEFYQNYFSNYERKNIHFLILPRFESVDQVYFAKLKIFEWEKIEEYENIFFLDSNVIVNQNLNDLFTKCLNPNSLYVPIEDDDFDNHRRIFFGLGNYSEEDVNYFRENKIYTFNSGTMMFKSSDEMKNHFNNILNFISNYQGDYFTEQSFLNYYFNKLGLVSYDLLKWMDNLYYIDNENFYQVEDFENKIFNLIGSLFSVETKMNKFVEFYGRLKTPSILRKKEHCIHFQKVSEDRKTIFFVSETDITCSIVVYIQNTIFHRFKMNLLKGVVYWVVLSDGFYNKVVEFQNEEFYQTFILHGKEQFSDFKVAYQKLYEKNTELSLVYREKNEEEFKKRKSYLDYYHQLLSPNKFKKTKILEFDIDTNVSLKNIIPNSLYIKTTSEMSSFVDSSDDNLYYVDTKSTKHIQQLLEIKKLEHNFDLIIGKSISLLREKINLLQIIEKLSIGGVLVIENIDLNDYDSLSILHETYNQNYCFMNEIISLSESYEIGAKLILKITKIK